ncbi:MAG: hypothetical protein RLZZ81_458 [Pseudomonadota bacterium]
MLVNPNRVNPELLAKEVNIMMSKVGKKLDNISTEEGKITYAKKKLFKYLEANNFTKVLAFKNCYEGNTGDTLNVINITNDSLYRDEFKLLIDTEDTLEILTPLLGRFFPE